MKAKEAAKIVAAAADKKGEFIAQLEAQARLVKFGRFQQRQPEPAQLEALMGELMSWGKKVREELVQAGCLTVIGWLTADLAEQVLKQQLGAPSIKQIEEALK